jgi:WASH complex subunit strumpellin
VFEVLEEVIQLLSKKMTPIPWKFNKNELKTFCQYDQRKEMAQRMYRISLFTESILSMETYLVGVIEVNPKVILDEGIRKEMIRLIFRMLDKHLQFKGTDVDGFQKLLIELAVSLEGFKKAVENIQDFVQIYGIKSYHEEFDKLMDAYIDME